MLKENVIEFVTPQNVDEMNGDFNNPQRRTTCQHNDQETQTYTRTTSTKCNRMYRSTVNNRTGYRRESFKIACWRAVWPTEWSRWEPYAMDDIALIILSNPAECRRPAAAKKKKRAVAGNQSSGGDALYRFLGKTE